MSRPVRCAVRGTEGRRSRRKILRAVFSPEPMGWKKNAFQNRCMVAHQCMMVYIPSSGAYICDLEIVAGKWYAGM